MQATLVFTYCVGGISMHCLELKENYPQTKKQSYLRKVPFFVVFLNPNHGKTEDSDGFDSFAFCCGCECLDW